MKDSEQLPEKKIQEERMQEVLLLLEHLVSHEEITVKLIIDCLLDVGAVNLINQKIQQPWLNRSLKKTAGVSKPLLKIIAFRWFKRNCPALIANWLYLKVSFPELVEPPLPSPEVMAAAAVEPPLPVTHAAVAAAPAPLVNSENLNLEIQRLRGQVKLLSGIAIGAVAALSGVLVWMNHRPHLESSHQPPQPLQTVDVDTSKLLLEASP